MDSVASSAPPRIAPVWVAAFMGMVVGFVEVAQLLIRKEMTGAFTQRAPQFPWLTPTAYLLLFALPAAAVVIASLVWRRLPATALVVFGCVTAGVASILTTQFQAGLHPVAVVVLALGLGFRASQLTARSGRTVYAVARASSPWMLLALGIIALGTVMVEKRREGRQPPPAAAGADAPNVLFLILDTVRASSLSLYGYQRATSPTLERLGREGIVFDRAFSTAPWTLPSHASFFTGRWPHEQSTGWSSPLDRADSTVAEAFSARGYVSGGFVGNSIYANAETGLARGFHTYRDYSLSLGTLLRSATLTRRITDSWQLRKLIGTDELLGRRTASDINAEFLAWEERLAGRPYFAFLNYFDAHDPYLPPPEWFERIAGYQRRDNLSPLRRLSVDARREGVSPADTRLEMDAYDASIAWIDHEIGLLLGELERRGTLRNTLVVVASDHGEEFGEHGIFLHGHSLFRRALQVPLVIWKPGRVPAGKRVSQPVSLRDIPATLLSLATGAANPFPGGALSRYWTDSATVIETPILVEVQQAVRVPDFYPAATGDLHGLIDSAFHFIQGPKSATLFAWDEQPIERVDLAGMPQWQGAVTAYREQLERMGVFRSSHWTGARGER